MTVRLFKYSKTFGVHKITVDDEDVGLLLSRTWTLVRMGSPYTLYAHNPNNGGKMHRLLMGAQRGELVDHVDGNGLNNCRENLRMATHQENQFNRGARSKNTTGFKGVNWDKSSRRFRAQATFNNRRYYLGMHPTAESAARAYDAFASKHHGAFAHLNFPEAT